jgi:hypothetical protein
MKFMFVVWGGFGLFANLFLGIGSLLAPSVGVGTSAYVSAMALVWIGGMLFFGLGSLLFRKLDQNFIHGLTARA